MTTNRISLLVSLVAVFAFTSVSAQQHVYKCTVNGIVTFSQQECGKDAKAIMDVPKQSPTALAQQNEQLKAVSDSVADSQCRRDVQKLAYVPDLSKINSLTAQVSNLESSSYVSVRTGASNANSQQLEASDRARAAGLRAHCHKGTAECQSERRIRSRNT